MTLNSDDELTQLIRNKNLFTWHELTEYIKSLPYGRTINRTDLSLVLTECKGSCSSKHALLKKVAILNKVPNIKLILGLYKMNSNNTPKIGNVLHKNNIDYLPEAHCYLMVNGERIDYTSSSSDFKRIKNDVVFEKEIEPHEIAKFKVEYHKNYLKTWIKEQNIPFSFDEIWNLREECISNLGA